MKTWTSGEQVYAADLNGNFAECVLLTGNQTIAGIKTFSSIPVGPASNPTTDNQLARKAYVDTKVGLSGNETVAGIKTFSSIPVLPASDPTTDNQAARKAYVDNKVKRFGAWVDSYSEGNVYQASTDGFVVCYAYRATGNYYLTGQTDAGNPPTTVRITNFGEGPITSPGAGFCMPVKSGDYWRIMSSGSPTVVVFWIPLQSV